MSSGVLIFRNRSEGLHEMIKSSAEHKSLFKYDPYLFFSVVLLVCIGMVMVYSASSELATKNQGNEYFFFIRQGIFAAAGFALMIICMVIPYRVYRVLAWPMLIFSYFLLAVLFIPGIGIEINGATRWIDLKFVKFQPSEFARLALVVFFAYSLSKREERLRSFKGGFSYHLVFLLLFSVLLLPQPDYGTLVIFWMIGMTMLFAAGVRFLHLCTVLILAVPLLVAGVLTSEYRVKRYMTFLDPWKHPLDAGYQIIHSMMAIGSGGMWGKGLGQGYQKLFYLPTPHTDFIFSIIGEETGFVGIMIVMILYLVIIWRGMAIALRCRETFASILAFGFTVSVGLQALVNMGVAVSLLPTKGLTLPFLSYGGSSLLFSMASAGILLSIGKKEVT